MPGSPTSKLFVSPILSTKSKHWNRLSVCLNQMLFDFCNDSNGELVALNFSEFCDKHGNILNDIGKFWNPSDPLHLGSRCTYKYSIENHSPRCFQ